MTRTRQPKAFVITREKHEDATAGEGVRDPRRPQVLPAEVTIRAEPEISSDTPETDGMRKAEGGLRKAFRWGRMLAVSLSGLLAMWSATVLYGMIEDLFARSPVLGWATTGLLTLAGLSALVIVTRELFGLFRLSRMTRLHEKAETALSTGDEEAMKSVLEWLLALYAGRPDMRWRLERLAAHQEAVMHPEERLALAERELLQPLDTEAARIIATTSRQVAVMTALIPMATLDMALVATRNLTMLRRLATLYGGRPGLFGGLKLARMVMTHIALTGSLALTDTLVQNMLGKGLAGRLSARFGEGAVNGILTARVGIATLGLVRPLPFRATPSPKLSDFAREIFTREERQEAE